MDAGQLGDTVVQGVSSMPCSTPRRRERRHLDPDFRADSWTQVGFADSDVRNVILDPASPDRLLVGATAIDVHFGDDSEPGVFLSEDRGQTFEDLTHALEPSDQAWKLAPDPGNEDAYLMTVYSGAGGLYRIQLP